MTRRKKTRKPGAIGVKSTPKVLREKNSGSQPGKSGKGQPAGSRQALKATASSGQRNVDSNQDPRLGSKRPISLVLPDAQMSPSSKPASAPTKPLTLEAEFEQLENDPRLQQLLSDLDDGKTLSDSDKAWMDKQLARYQVIAEKLGIELDDEEEDEDDLEPWQRFENPKDWIE